MRYIKRVLFVLVLVHGLLFSYSSASYSQTVPPAPTSVIEAITSTTEQTPVAVLSFCGETNEGVLDIGDSQSKIGEEFTIDVLIQGAPNQVYSFGCDITFDPQVFKFLGYNDTAITNALDGFDVTENESGRIRIGGYDTDAGAITEGIQGKLVVLKLKVLGGEEDWSYSFIIENLKDDISTWTYSGGCSTILTSCDGDLTGDGSITPGDALAGLKCYLGSGECTYCSDLNKSGDVTPADALCAFQTYLGLSSCVQQMVTVPPSTDSDAPLDVLVPTVAYRGVSLSVVKPIVSDLTVAGTQIGELEAMLKKINSNKVLTEADAEKIENMVNIGEKLYSAFNVAFNEAEKLSNSKGKEGSIKTIVNFENTVRGYQTRLNTIATQTDSLEAKIKTGVITLDKSLLDKLPAADLQEFKDFLTPSAQQLMINKNPTIFLRGSSLNLFYRTKRVMAQSVTEFLDSLPDQMSNLLVGEAEASLAIPCIAPCWAMQWSSCVSCIVSKGPAAIKAYNDMVKCWNGCCSCKWYKPWCCGCKVWCVVKFVAKLA